MNRVGLSARLVLATSICIRTSARALTHVSSQKEVTQRDTEIAAMSQQVREELVKHRGLSGVELEDAVKAHVEYGGNLSAAVRARRAEEEATESKTIVPTQVRFTPELVAKMAALKADGGVVAEKTRANKKDLEDGFSELSHDFMDDDSVVSPATTRVGGIPNSIELALKSIYEGRRNDPELVANELQQLTRKLYDGIYGGSLLGKEVTLKPQSEKTVEEFSDRQKKRYAMAVQELTWLEEWALQEIVIAINEADANFDGTPEEYKLQLQHLRDDIHVEVLKRVHEAIEERLGGKPLAYIMGSTPFCEAEILCEIPVMCPRVQTEHWVGWLAYTLSQTAIAEATPKPTAAEMLLSAASQVTTSITKSLFSDFGAKYNPSEVKALKVPAPDDPTLKSANRIDILDMGCGSGNIGIALAKAIAGARVVGMDITPEAIALSRRNAAHNKLHPHKYRAEQSDLFALCIHNSLLRHGEAANNSTSSKSGVKYIPDLGQLQQLVSEEELRATAHFLLKAEADKEPFLPTSYDMIVCNPPCVHPDDYAQIVKNNGGSKWETELALVGDQRRRRQQELYFRDLCILGHKFTKPVHMRASWIPKSCPSIAFEVGIQGAVVADLFTQSKLWEQVNLHVDNERMPRWVTAVRRDFDW